MKYPVTEPEISQLWVYDMSIEMPHSPSNIWPWLAQMGNGRAGWYSYDLIDNLGKKSFEYIDADLVKIQKGQKIPFATIKDFEVDRFLTYQFGDKVSATYYLEPENPQRTRLWARLRYQNPHWLTRATLKIAHEFMQKKQFDELKKRLAKNESTSSL